MNYNQQNIDAVRFNINVLHAKKWKISNNNVVIKIVNFTMLVINKVLKFVD